jgi:ABC-2 type transport system ATP-binding protein
MPVIEVSNLHKRYGGTVAVDDVSFTVEDGEIFGIIGPNGAGKTTTVECVEGLRRPDRGARTLVRGRSSPRPSDRWRSPPSGCCA